MKYNPSMIRKTIIVTLSLSAAASGLLIPISFLYPRWRFGNTDSVSFSQPDGSSLELPNGFLISGGRLSYTWFDEETSTPPPSQWIAFAGFEFREICRGKRAEVGSTMSGGTFHFSVCVPSINVQIPLVAVLLVSAPYPNHCLHPRPATSVSTPAVRLGC